jgi:hypothetical protein
MDARLGLFGWSRRAVYRGGRSRTLGRVWVSTMSRRRSLTQLTMVISRGSRSRTVSRVSTRSQTTNARTLASRRRSDRS